MATAKKINAVERAAQDILAGRKKASRDPGRRKISTNDSDRNDSQMANKTMPQKRVTRSSALLAGNAALGDTQEPTHDASSNTVSDNEDELPDKPAIGRDSTARPTTNKTVSRSKRDSGTAAAKKGNSKPTGRDKVVSSDGENHSDTSSVRSANRKPGSSGRNKEHDYGQGTSSDKLRELERKLKAAEGQCR